MSSMSIYEYDKTLRPHGVVYALAAALLDPCRGAGVRNFGKAAVCSLLERDDETIAVVWATARSEEREVELSHLPAGTRVLDVMTNPLARAEGGRARFRLGRQPTYIVAPKSGGPAMVRSVEAALRALGS